MMVPAPTGIGIKLIFLFLYILDFFLKRNCISVEIEEAFKS